MASTALQDLSDDVLLRIYHCLDPHPHGFVFGRVCLRFKRLAHDKRNWLVVLPTAQPSSQAQAATAASSTPARLAPNEYRSLASAVAASRPGDTVFLRPGVHHVTSTCRLDKCITLLGGGADSTELRAARPHAALHVAAACRISGLRIRSVAAACIEHHSGQLHVESCHLHCDALGLDHLFSPLVTTATTTSLTISTTGAAPQLQAKQQGQGLSAGFAGTYGSPPPAQGSWPSTAAAGAPGLAAQGAAPGVPPAGPGAGGAGAGGRLSVADCSMEGGIIAVQCLGSGALRDARAVFLGRRKVLFFSVDSQVPGQAGAGKFPALRAACAAAAAAAAAGAAVPAGSLQLDASVEGQGKRGAGQAAEEAGAAGTVGGGPVIGLGAVPRGIQALAKRLAHGGLLQQLKAALQPTAPVQCIAAEACDVDGGESRACRGVHEVVLEGEPGEEAGAGASVQVGNKRRREGM